MVDEEKIPLSGNCKGLVTYKQRWIILAVICLVSGLRSFCLHTISPVNKEIQKYFEKEGREVDWLSGTIHASVIPTCCVLVLFSYKFNLRNMTLMASILITIGLLISSTSLLFANWFWLVIIGQLVVGSASGMIMVVPVVMSAQWFAHDETATVLSLPWLFSSVSSAFGGFLSSNIIPAYENGTEHNVTYHCQWKKDVQKSLSVLFVSLLAVAFLALILCVFVLKNFPKTTPTLAQFNEVNYERNLEKMTFVEQFRKNIKCNIIPLLRNPSYILFTASYFLISTMQPIGTVLQASTTQRSFPQIDSRFAGIISLVGFSTSALGGPVSGLLVDQTKKFKWVLIIGLFLSLLAVTLEVLFHHYHILPGLFVSTSLILFSMEYSLVVILETIVEVIYPLNKVTAVAMFMIAHSIADVVFIATSRFALDRNVFYETLLPLPALLLSSILVIFHQPHYKRILVNEGKIDVRNLD